MTFQEKLKLVELYYNQGLNDKQISKLLNYQSSTSIIKFRNILGLSSVRDKNQNYINEIKTLVNKGLNDKQIAEKLNITRKKVNYLRSCGKILPYKPINNYNNQVDRIKGYIIRNSKHSAKRRNLEFNITYNDFDLPIYCPLLNIKLTYGNQSGANDDSHASLDRIDNNKGYIKNNVIIISKLANAMKNSASFEQLNIFSNNILLLLNYYKNQSALGNITDVFTNIEIYKDNLDF
jgi:transposase